MEREKIKIDEIHDLLQWIADRNRYAIACNKAPAPDDAFFEMELLGELGKFNK